MPKRRSKPKTYPVEVDGRKVRVTIPEDDKPDVLRDWLCDNLTPQAVATIVSFLQPVRTDDQDVDEEVRWFAEQLVAALGGHEAQGRLAEEVGL